MFLMKKIVSRFLFPVPLSLELLSLYAGIDFLLCVHPPAAAGKALVTCGAIVLLGLSNGKISDALLRPLEHRYPPLTVAHAGAAVPAVSFIAVLGGFGDHDPDVPITSLISPDQMERLIEGVHLYREIPGSKLILSGGYDCAEGMTKVAEALGVSAQDVLRLNALATRRKRASRLLPHRGFATVHPRFLPPHTFRASAMELFRNGECSRSPLLLIFLTPHHPFELDDVFPDAYKLFKSDGGLCRYLGRGWERLRGGI